jgi:hypothetical protein
MELNIQGFLCYKGHLLGYLSKTKEVEMEWICSSVKEEKEICVEI